MCPVRNTPTHGSNIILADTSEGCQLVRALANLCRMGAYNGSRRSPVTKQRFHLLLLLLWSVDINVYISNWTTI